MGKSIIEKLGLLPNVRIVKSKEGIAYSTEETYDLNLIKVATEMFEALIDDIQSYEFSPGDMFPHSNYKRNISIIEKACHPKSWPEIKELINEQ